MQDSPLLLFDGVCHLCAHTVQWILKRDRKGIFRFAPLQSEVGQEVLKRLGITEKINSIVLVVGERAFLRADAVFEVVKRLGFPWALLGIFNVIPRSVCNMLYDCVARHRYKWFGRSKTCWVPQKKWEERFLT
ncbi:MAG: DCC1-like thiol-disulfide oxidoreductase family protein [Saprospiraceae bacterium]|nr:DCC1-like thiol-disulfide oxidoreductase family protein [Saprospiraceae bacterium]MDW8484624.1 DCC1-like thiol-disulfide oxidoreductase family protein [Saprospiraceae bacterium]